MDWNSLNNTAILIEIGRRMKDCRLKKKLSQKELARKAGISLFTVTQIEKGKPVSINMLLSIMRVLRLLENIEMLLPDTGISPIEMLKHKGKQPQRIRPKKNK